MLQPDICVICDPSMLDDRGCLGAPDLIIEILSPGNSKKEVKNKYEAYEDAGVKEYWIADPIRQTLQVYLLEDGRFSAQRTLTNEDVVTSTVVKDFSMNLTELFTQ